MRTIIRFFIDRPKVANLILLFIFLTGGMTLFSLRNEGYPPIDFGTMSITTVYPGASPADVEAKVTSKIEDKLVGVSGIARMQSSSLKGLSVITLRLDEDADLDETKDDIAKAVDQVDRLPKGILSRPNLFEVKSDTFPVYELAITGPAPYIEKRKVARILSSRLKNIDGVGEVTKLGYLKQEVRINLSAKKMKTNMVSFNDVIQAVQFHNIRLSGGDLISDTNQKTLIVDTEFESLADVEDVIIRSSFEGSGIGIKDIATIEDGFADQKKIYEYNGDAAIQLLILKKQDADIKKTAQFVQDELQSFSQSLPDTIQLEQIVDYSDEVNNLLNLVLSNGQLGFFLVILCLLIFLNVRVAFWTALGIPVSLLFAFFLFPIFDTSFNFITLTAMVVVLGMLVDDAILVAENIYHYKEKGLPANEAAEKGTLEVLWPVITTVSTTIIAFLPMMVTQGVFGKFIFYFPVVISFTLLGSLVESIFILPAHIAHTRMSKRKRFNFMSILEPYYNRLMLYTFSRPFKVLLVSLVVLISGITLSIFFSSFRLFPSDDGLIGYMRFKAPEGSSLNRTHELAQNLSAVVDTFPKSEVTGYVLTIGERSPQFVSYGINTDSSDMGHLVFHLTPMADRDRTATEIVREMDAKIAPYSDLFERLEVSVMSEGPPVGKAVTVTLISDNDAVRQTMFSTIKSLLKETKGVFNISDNRGSDVPQFMIDLDEDQMARLGVQPFQIANSIRYAFEGAVVSTLRRQAEELDYRIILNESDRQDLDTIELINVRNRYGQLIPISSFISLKDSPGVKNIPHYDARRSVTLYADVDTDITSSGAVNDSIRNMLTPFFTTYPSLSVEFGGEEKDTEDSLNSLFKAMILALVGIYFILVILFNSFFQPFLVMAAIPFSFIGVIIAFILGDMPLSFPAIIGMVGLTGVVVNNSLVLISFLNRYSRYEGDFIKNLADGATRRLRPIMLTTFTTAAGLLPTAYGFGGQNPVIIPIVYAIAWGLVFSTFVTLFFLPSLYLVQYYLSRWFTSLFQSNPVSDRSLD